jgi:hypothetical protein
MGDTGYVQLIDELTRPRQPSAHVVAAPEETGAPLPSSQTVNATPPQTTAVPSRAEAPTQVPETGAPPLQPKAASEPTPGAVVEHARQTHERLTLATWESSYMKLLFPLIPSPRAAKRFVNVYRLLRGVLPNEDRASLIGNEKQGGYRAALLLLAMVTGYPVEATIVIRELLERVKKTGGSEEWWTMLDAIRGTYLKDPPSPNLKNASSPKGSRRVAPKAEPPQERPADDPDDTGYRWEELFESLDLLRHNVGGDLSATKVARWAPVVARYSFASGRLLVADSRARLTNAVH